MRYTAESGLYTVEGTNAFEYPGYQWHCDESFESNTLRWIYLDSRHR